MRLVAKISANNALIIFDRIVRNSKEYDNMIEAFNISMSQCDELSLDICAYTILRITSDCKSKTLDNEANIEQWL